MEMITENGHSAKVVDWQEFDEETKAQAKKYFDSDEVNDRDKTGAIISYIIQCFGYVILIYGTFSAASMLFSLFKSHVPMNAFDIVPIAGIVVGSYFLGKIIVRLGKLTCDGVNFQKDSFLRGNSVYIKAVVADKQAEANYSKERETTYPKYLYVDAIALDKETKVRFRIGVTDSQYNKINVGDTVKVIRPKEKNGENFMYVLL